MWMGGTVPIGYLAKERTLEIEPIGAALIHEIFSTYLACRNVRALQATLQNKGIRSPIAYRQSGQQYGGKILSRGQLYGILSNPIYIGRVPHKDISHPGLHPPLITQEMWDQTQETLKSNKQGYENKCSAPSASLLTGIIFDGDGNRLVPSHSQKQSARYRYYVSEPLITNIRESSPQGLRLPAIELENLVIRTITSWLLNTDALLSAIHIAPEHIQATQNKAHQLAQQLKEVDPYTAIKELIKEIRVHSDQLQIEINLKQLHHHADGTHILHIYTQIKKCGRAMRLLIRGSHAIDQSKTDPKLIEQLSRSAQWLSDLTTGKVKSIKDLANQEKVHPTYVARVLDRALLAPDIVRAILNGTQPPELNLEYLTKKLPLPIDWNEQRKLLGF